MRLILVLFYCLFLSLIGQAQFWPKPGQQIRKVHMNDKLGLTRSFYPKLLALPLYDEITWANKNCLLVKKGNYYGILDTLGVIKIKPDTYTQAYSRDDIESGKILIVFLFYNQNGQEERALADENGNIVAKNFDQIIQKSGDLIVVKVSEFDSIQNKLYFEESDKGTYHKYGVLKVDGSWLIKPEHSLFYFINDFCITTSEDPYPNRLSALLNIKGKAIIKDDALSYNYDRSLNDSLQKLKQFCLQNDVTNWFVDSMGTIVAKLPRRAPNLKVVLDSASKKYGGKLAGRWVIPARYDDIRISGHYAMAYDKTKNTSDLYDKNGKLLPCDKYKSFFSPLYQSKNRKKNPEKEFLFGYKDEDCFLLNEKFIPVFKTPHQVGFILYSKNGTTLFSFTTKDNKYGVMNQIGKIIINPIYEDQPYEENNLLIVKTALRSSMDVYDLKGTIIFSDIYAVKNSTLNPTICYGRKAGGEAVYSLKDSKVIIPRGTYTSFNEIAKYGIVVASKDEKKFILDKNFQLLSATSFSVINQDKSAPIVTTFGGKKQVIDISSNKLSEEYDEIYSPYYYNPTGLNENIVVRNGRKYGLMDDAGKTLASCEWDTILFSGKKAILKSAKNYYFTDTNYVLNKTIVSDSILQFNWGANTLYRRNSKWYSLDYPDAQFECDQVLKYTANHLISLKKEGKYGVYSVPHKKWTVNPIFENEVICASNLSNGNKVFLTQMNDKIFFIDTLKNTKLEPSFDFIEPIDQMIQGSNKYLKNHLVNNGGKKVAGVPNSSKNDAITGGKFGISNSTGKLLHPMNGDHAIALIDNNYDNYDDSENERSNVLGFLWNIGGTVEDYICCGRDSISQEQFDEYGNSYYVKVAGHLDYDKKISGGKFGIVDPNGKEILPEIYDQIIFMYNSSDYYKDSYHRKNYSEYNYQRSYNQLALYPIFLKKDNKWGAADLSGKLIIPLAYDSIADASSQNEKMIQVWKNDKYGYFDLFGKALVPVEYTGEQIYVTKANVDNSGTFVILQKDGSMKEDYYVNRVEQVQYTETGEEKKITEEQKISYNYFSGGKLGIFELGTYKILLAPEYEDIRFMQVAGKGLEQRFSVTQKTEWHLSFLASEHSPYFEIKKSGKWGVYRFMEGIIIKPRYEDIEMVFSTSLEKYDESNYRSDGVEILKAVGIKFKQNGKWGILSLNGKIMLKPEFSSIRLVGNQYETIKNDLTNYFDLDGNPRDKNGNPK